eukprot:g37480.t1
MAYSCSYFFWSYLDSVIAKPVCFYKRLVTHSRIGAAKLACCAPVINTYLERGTILKTLSLDSKNLRGCYLEELQLVPPGKQEPIRSLQILHSDRSLFVGLNGRVLKIPLERCFSYKTE